MKFIFALFIFIGFTGCSILPIQLNVGKGKAPTYAEVKEEKKYGNYSQVAVGKWKDEQNRVIINGIPVNTSDYPWIFWIRSDGSMCTASLVGPNVIATAAHCVGNGEALTFRHGAGSYSAVCTHHPDYRSADHDLALCRLLKSPEVKPIPMHLNHHARMDMRLQIFGFGCVRPGGGGGNEKSKNEFHYLGPATC